MAIQTFKARVSDHSLIKGKFQWVQFELVEPNQIEFTAGQYIMLNIPGMAAKRDYSIASPPASNTQLDILVDVGPQGDGSLFLQSLNPGEEVNFMAPGGQFVIADDPVETKLVMIATGSGISAIRSMILDLLQTKLDKRPITLQWGLRYVEDIFWEDEFRLLEKEFENFNFDLVLSKAPHGWPLCAGHVTACLEKHYQDYTQTGYYLCGNQTMIQEVTQFLAQKNVAPANVHFEKFY